MENEKRLIDADALSVRVMDTSYWDNQDEDVIWNLVQDAPTVDAVEVVHGRWIDAIEFCGDYICSNCESLYGTNKFNYCPNCGADMRGVEDGKETNQNEILGHTPN